MVSCFTMLQLVPPSKNQCFPFFTFHERLLCAKDALSVFQNNFRQPISFLVSEYRQILINIKHTLQTPLFVSIDTHQFAFYMSESLSSKMLAQCSHSIRLENIRKPWALCKKGPYSELFWSAFFLHFPAFGLKMERYGVSLRTQSECWKNANQNNSEYGHFMQ